MDISVVEHYSDQSLPTLPKRFRKHLYNFLNNREGMLMGEFGLFTFRDNVLYFNGIDVSQDLCELGETARSLGYRPPKEVY